jgi:hypothetical protein
MPLKIVSDEELDKELENCRLEVKSIQSDSVSLVKELSSPGRKEGDNNVPRAIQRILAETSQIEGRQDAIELARELQISPQSVDAYSAGATSLATYKEKNEDLLSHINSRKLLSAKKAQSRLLRAIHHITEDKLINAKPAVLAVVAKAMSSIVKDMEPDSGVSQTNGPTFVFYAPRVTKEESFDVITVKE